MWTNEYEPEEFGFQVLLSVYNGENYIEKCLESLNDSLSGANWILMYGDDGCTDGTTIELARNISKLNCDKVHLYEYDKADTVGQAKNRLIKEAHSYKEKYPYILFMDVDDIMLPERPMMVHTAIENNCSFVVGDYLRTKITNETVTNKSTKTVDGLQYGPWATLFHCDFLPEDGLFFPEDEVSNNGFEDILTWYHLKYIKNITAFPHIGNPVHHYIERKGSTSQQENVNYQRNTFWGMANIIKNEKKNIFKNPFTREESDRAGDEHAKKVSEKTPSSLD